MQMYRRLMNMQDDGYHFICHAASRTPMTHDMLPKSEQISTQRKEGGGGEPLVGACSADTLLLGGSLGQGGEEEEEEDGVDPGHSK